MVILYLLLYLIIGAAFWWYQVRYKDKELTVEGAVILPFMFLFWPVVLAIYILSWYDDNQYKTLKKWL